jgi:hypothetical protein
VQAVCVAAYEAHLDALDASARAKALLQRPDGGTEAALRAAVELSLAERALEKARVESERCAREQGRLALEQRKR